VRGGETSTGFSVGIGSGVARFTCTFQQAKQRRAFSRTRPAPDDDKQYVLGVLWGLTFTGYFLVLRPLSFFKHRLVWRARTTGGVAAPKVDIAAANIRAIALKLIALAVLGYVAWALLQVVFTTVRSSANVRGAPGGP
jgi:hypothetical protein